MINKRFAFCLLLISACTQTPKTIELGLLEANHEGLRILKESLSKHGDVNAEDLKLSIDVTNEEFVHLGQSLVPLPDFEPNSWNRSFSVDRSAGTEFSVSRQQTSGYDFYDILLLNEEDGINYNFSTSSFTGGHSSWFNNLDILPTFILNALMDNKISVRYIGEEILESKDYYKLEAAAMNAFVRILIDKESGLLTKTEVLRTSGTYGDSWRTYLYDDYQNINGLMLPSAVTYIFTNQVTGPTTNVYRISPSSTEDTPLKDQVTSFTPGDYSYRKMSEVIDLGNGAYMIENITNSRGFWSYNILFAEFDDHILVTEAAVNVATSERVIDLIKETIPNKPIRYVVQSHHHNDHIAGIRGYIGEGTTIITTEGNIELIQKLAKAPFESRPDILTSNPAEPKLEIVQNKKLVLTDESMTVEIYDIGPTGHANEMLITYLPKHKILFQADMINFGEWSTEIDLCQELVSRIKELDLEVDQIVGLHGRVIDKPGVEKLLAGTL